MLHELIHVQVLAKDFVVSFMQGDTVIVDASTGINLPMDISISLGFIQLELVGFHALIVP